MDTETEALIDTLTLAKTDKRTLNGLLTRYMPFIKKTVSSMFYKKEQRQDYVTDAMLAFAHSVQTYNSETGSFIAYAQTVIRNRLIDTVRKEIKIQEPLISIFMDVDEKDGQWENDIAERTCDLVQERTNLCAEIACIDKEFIEWGFDWENLVKKCPKQERSRLTCHKIARSIIENEELVTEMLQKRQVPVSRLSAKTGYSQKIFEKYRNYIAAIVMIMRGDYPYIHSFLPQFFYEEASF
ncbi:hypothetical protein AGMMS49940_20920 [Spirochaetia bacterium]|nr:hypothetical protein AGMMS49940_20920 [Spirochaetia bacterium]